MAALVERERELGRIDACLEQAAGGRGATMLVLGPAGQGKTALTRAAVSAADERGFTALVATADQLGTRSPFGVVRRLLDQALMALAPADREALGVGLARLAVDYLVGEVATPVEHGDLMAGFDWLVAGLARRGPLLLVADDVQWADEESLLFLGSLRHRISTLPVLVLAAAREVGPDGRRPALAALVADRDAEVLRLDDPLSEAGVSRLLRDAWGEVDPEAAHAVSEVSGGNPFLVLAVARLLTGTGRVTAPVVRDVVPGSVIDSVVERLAGLGDAERDLARAVAVLETTPTGTAAELAGLDLDRASRAADRLRAAGLFGVEAGLEYRHALLRSAVYAATGVDTREQLHRAAARMLAATDVHAAAAHLMQTTAAGDPWAAEVLGRAAALAMDEGAPHSAVALLRRAVAEPPPADQAAAVLLRLGLAEMRTLDARCVVSLGQAEQGLLDPSDRAQCALALAEAFSYAGFHEPAAEALERALERVDDPDLVLELEAALIATSLLLPERIADARRRLGARPGLTGATRAERLFLNQQLSDAVGTNQPAPVIRDLARRALHPSDSPERTEWVWARLFLAAIGDYDQVRRLTDDGFAKAAANGSVLGFVTASFIRGLAELSAGALPAAEEHFRAMLDSGEPISPGPLVSLLGRGELAQALTLQGRVDEAVALLAEFPEEPPAEWPVNGLATLHYARAVVRHAAGDHAGALASAERLGALVTGLDVDSPTWAAWRPLAIGPLRALGRPDEARAHAERHVELCERSQVAPLLGEALRLLGELEDDPGLLERALAVLTDAQSPLQEGRARLSLGSALRRAGQRAQAREQLQIARAQLVSCGATPWVEHAQAELAAAGSRIARIDLTGVGALTASERRVADLAAQGRTNTEIARMLFVSPKTVETHLSRVYRKLDIGGRTELPEVLTGD